MGTFMVINAGINDKE